MYYLLYISVNYYIHYSFKCVYYNKYRAQWSWSIECHDSLWDICSINCMFHDTYIKHQNAYTGTALHKQCKETCQINMKVPCKAYNVFVALWYIQQSWLKLHSDGISLFFRCLRATCTSTTDVFANLIDENILTLTYKPI